MSRKRQRFGVDEVVDMLLNGKISEQLNSEIHPPPAKRTSLSNDPIKAVTKLESKRFYSTSKLLLKNDEPAPTTPKASKTLKEKYVNSPSATEKTPSSSKLPLSSNTINSPLVRTKEASEKQDGLSPTTAAAKWANIFLKESPKPNSEDAKKSHTFSSWIKKSQDKPGETASQTILDAGQKEFGVAQCPECSMVYELKSPDDEILHMKHHASVKDVLRYSNTMLKNLCPIRSLEGGFQIYQASRDSTLQKALVAKCDAVLALISREIEYAANAVIEKLAARQKAYVCVDPVSSNVIGLCVAESATRAFPTMSTTWPVILERDSRKTVAGIRVLWVAKDFRRKGIGKALMESVRSCFVYGCILSKREIAVSSPTSDGFHFYKSFFGSNLPKPSDENANSPAPQSSVTFLVYDM